jgi:hypothetical protein
MLIVRDRVRSATPHTFSFLLHAPADSKITTSGAQAVFQTKTAAASMRAMGENAAWSVATVPIQSTLFTDLDHQHIEPRQELVLTSPITTETQFLTGMTFTRGMATPHSALKPLTSANSIGFAAGAANETPRIVFRSRPGALVLGAFSTDGDTLAQSTADTGLALGARELQRDGHVLLRADAPVDVAWQETAAEFDLHAFAAHDITLEIAAGSESPSVTIDGKAVPVTTGGTIVAVPLTGGEEHHVSVQ